MTTRHHNDLGATMKGDSAQSRSSLTSSQDPCTTSSGKKDNLKDLEELEQFIKETNIRCDVVFDSTHREKPSVENVISYRPRQGTEISTDADAGNNRIEEISVTQYAEGRSLQELDLLGIGSGHKDLNGSYKAGRI